MSKCKHENWSNDPDCECTVNHCLVCHSTEVGIHAASMEEVCAKQETEIADLEATVKKYQNALLDIQDLDHEERCKWVAVGEDHGACNCHVAIAEGALT